tara:strand:+ start:519 stop:731 length:213 start_codon:yes stop_codon:yes gene_type:complete
MALKTDLRSSDDKKFKGHTEDKTIKVAAKPGDKLNLFKKFKAESRNRAVLGGKLLLGNIKYLIKSSLGKK